MSYCQGCADSDKRISGLESQLCRAREALEEIAKGEGAFSLDPLTHASNTIDSMKEIAKQALSSPGPCRHYIRMKALEKQVDQLEDDICNNFDVKALKKVEQLQYEKIQKLEQENAHLREAVEWACGEGLEEGRYLKLYCDKGGYWGIEGREEFVTELRRRAGKEGER